MSYAAPNSALSGKRLTITLMIVLLATGGLFYWVTMAYSNYNAARRQTDREWRELATLLETRYQLFDQQIAQADAQQMDAGLQAEWRTVRDAYTGTGIRGLQIDSAIKAESIIGRLPVAISASQPPSEDLVKAITEYDQSADQQRAIGQTVGSRLLKIMLNLPDPKSFVLGPSSDEKLSDKR